MKFRLFAFALSLAAFPALSQVQAPQPGAVKTLPPETPLVEDGGVRVDAADFEGNMLRMPEDRRVAFRMGYDRVAAVVDNIYITRSVAQKARDAGMDKDPAVQARLRQLQDGFLAELYSQKMEKETAALNLEQRARELYLADKEKYQTDEEAHVQQILVGNTCRTNIQARELARQALDEVKAGKNFLEVSQKYSDVGEKANKGGDLGFATVKRLVPSVREAVANLKPGEISEPVESQFGFHVLKLVDRRLPKAKPFEAVKAEIMAAERAKAQQKRIEDVITQVRGSKTVTTHRQNVEQLVTQGVDVDDMTRRAREANRAPAAAPKKQ